MGPNAVQNQHQRQRALADLFIRQARHLELWVYYGRSDDVLNFFTAEKLYLSLQSSTAVEEVIMVGTTRPKSAFIMR
jgi:hypothetical protein